jgi:hypothetical protein
LLSHIRKSHEKVMKTMKVAIGVARPTSCITAKKAQVPMRRCPLSGGRGRTQLIIGYGKTA